MTDSESFAFSDVVKDLLRVFPKRLEEHEIGRMCRDYFRAFRRFPLGQVQAGAEAWIQKGKFFPKPAEWIDAMPKRQVATVEIPAMSEAEAHVYHRAEKLRYADTPCHCTHCTSAGVHGGVERPLRFVPDGEDRKVRDPLSDRIVVAGRWIHGHELARWYKAKGDFYAAYLEAVGSLRMA